MTMKVNNRLIFGVLMIKPHCCPVEKQEIIIDE
jgi:hypothetical protein